MDRGEGGLVRKRIDDRSKEVNLFQIYNTDSDNAMELDSHSCRSVSSLLGSAYEGLWLKYIDCPVIFVSLIIVALSFSTICLRISHFYFSMGAGKGYNSVVECHLDVV